jgi:hypothetical protein
MTPRSFLDLPDHRRDLVNRGRARKRFLSETASVLILIRAETCIISTWFSLFEFQYVSHPPVTLRMRHVHKTPASSISTGRGALLGGSSVEPPAVWKTPQLLELWSTVRRGGLGNLVLDSPYPSWLLVQSTCHCTEQGETFFLECTNRDCPIGLQYVCRFNIQTSNWSNTTEQLSLLRTINKPP